MFQLTIYIMIAIIADIVGKEIITVCMFLGIIITSVMQLPCVIKLLVIIVCENLLKVWRR